MKHIIFLLVVLVSLNSIAQTVTRVQGSEVMVTLEGHEDFVAGDRVHFLNHQLNTTGEGEVVKLSAGGKKALVKILAGKVQTGMTLEKKEIRQQSRSNQETERSSLKADGMSYASLSEADRQILARGEMSTTRYVLGGVLGTYPLGFGIGHAIQGRYSEKGWIFTVGELSSIAVLAAGLGSCFGDALSSNDGDCNTGGGLVFLGAFGFVGFRVWEIVDLWATPLEQDRRYRELKSRLPVSEVTFEPGFVPLAGGGALGLRVTF